jgi:AP2-like factor (ANT lineage)
MASGGSSWLGFSLAQHKAMEAPSAAEPAPAHHAPPPSGTTISSSGNNNAAATSNLLYSPMAAPYSGYYCVGGAYGDGTSSAGVYYSHLPAMPIKSDGSFCNMEGYYPALLSLPPSLTRHRILCIYL